jgi:hypothetical protein
VKSDVNELKFELRRLGRWIWYVFR